jgi:hypothetical protein
MIGVGKELDVVVERDRLGFARARCFMHHDTRRPSGVGLFRGKVRELIGELFEER